MLNEKEYIEEYINKIEEEKKNAYESIVLYGDNIKKLTKKIEDPKYRDYTTQKGKDKFEELCLDLDGCVRAEKDSSSEYSKYRNQLNYLNLLQNGLIIADWYKTEMRNDFHQCELEYIYEYFEEVLNENDESIDDLNKKIQFHISKMIKK